LDFWFEKKPSGNPAVTPHLRLKFRAKICERTNPFFFLVFVQRQQGDQGPMLRFLKYFRRKIYKKLAFLTQNKAKL
jgi:hypothetical protein